MKATDIVTLPRGGVTTTRLGLGTAQLGGLYRPTGEQEARALVDGAWALGLRYFDTAPFYGYTMSEHRLGAALRERPRADYVLSTKVGRLMHPDAQVQPGSDEYHSLLPFRPHYDYSHDGILRSFEDSLQRLGVARIDLLFVHDIGSFTHGGRAGEYWAQLTRGGGFRALTTLRDQGRVRAIGLGVNEWEVLRAALDECELDCSMLAGRYTLLEQHSLLPLLEPSRQRGHAIVAAGVFNSGILGRTSGQPGKFNYADAPPEVVARVARLEAVCRRHDVPLQAAALQFPLAHPAVACVATGAHTLDQLQQNVRWFEQPLPDELWRELRRQGLLHEQAPVPGET